jgi:CBS domain-containing protein
MPMLKSVSLRDYMLAHPVTLHADQDIFEAIDLITTHRISGLCVVDEQQNLIGILSEIDCLKAILSATYNRGGAGSVAAHMTRENLVVAHPNEDIVSVAEDMLKRGQRRRPVVEDGKLIGQITCRAMLAAVRQFST